SKPVPRAASPATSPGPMLRSPQRSFGRCPAHPHLLGPAHRHDAGCPRGRSCRRAGRSGRQAPPSPCDTAFSEGSGSSQVLPGSSPITFTSPSSKAHQKSGPFPPPSITQLRRYYDPVRLPLAPPPIATLRPLPSRGTGLPRLPEPPFRRAVPTTPADQAGARVDCFPARAAFPKWQEGSASALSLSRPAQASLALQPTGSLSRPRRPLSRGSGPSGHPAEPLVSYQINRQFSGWIPPPLVIRAFGANCQKPTTNYKQSPPKP